MTRNGHIFNYL